MIIGAFSIGNAFPNLSHLATARGAAYTVFEIIDTVSMSFVISLWNDILKFFNNATVADIEGIKGFNKPLFMIQNVDLLLKIVTFT